MLTIAEAQRQTELFLTGQMFEALHAVEYELPSFDTEAREVQLADVARSRVEIRHVRGAKSPRSTAWRSRCRSRSATSPHRRGYCRQLG